MFVKMLKTVKNKLKTKINSVCDFLQNVLRPNLSRRLSGHYGSSQGSIYLITLYIIGEVPYEDVVRNFGNVDDTCINLYFQLISQHIITTSTIYRGMLHKQLYVFNYDTTLLNHGPPDDKLLLFELKNQLIRSFAMYTELCAYNLQCPPSSMQDLVRSRRLIAYYDELIKTETKLNRQLEKHVNHVVWRRYVVQKKK